MPAIPANQRHFADCSIEFEVAGGEVTGELRVGAKTYKLEEFRAAYPRLMDDRCLPELASEPDTHPCAHAAGRFTTP